MGTLPPSWLLPSLRAQAPILKFSISSLFYVSILSPIYLIPGSLAYPLEACIFCCCISSVQLLSRVRLFATPWTEAHQVSLSITNSQSLLKCMSIESVIPYNHLFLCHPLLLLPSIFSSIRVFSVESVLCIRCPKYWSFSFSISPSNEYSGLISFRMDWLDLLAVQGTLKSPLQHHSSKASILQHSAFMVQLSHPYMTTGKTIPLIIWNFVSKVKGDVLFACKSHLITFLFGSYQSPSMM